MRDEEDYREYLEWKAARDAEPKPSPPEINPDIPRVMVAVPHYGAIEAATAWTISRGTKRPDMIQVPHFAQASSSILPHCFNELLCQALMLRDDGRITHLAMVHADIEAPRGWLDLLYGEMWANGLVAVSSVVPMKSPGGESSTAIGNEFDRWDIRRKIRLSDRDRLPVTFQTKHCCEPGEILLINTGLMLLDLRHEFWNTFAFQFHTRIRRARDNQGGIGYQAWCRSEDWEMSYDLHEAGLPYGATWRVPVTHHGRGTWNSHK